MNLDEKTKSILIQKLNFTPEQLVRLDHNVELQKETMNLMKMARQSPQNKKVKNYVQVQFKKIKQSLNHPSKPRNTLLRQARAEYYTFRRTTR